jgi:hypothetical protein
LSVCNIAGCAHDNTGSTTGATGRTFDISCKLGRAVLVSTIILDGEEVLST